MCDQSLLKKNININIFSVDYFQHEAGFNVHFTHVLCMSEYVNLTLCCTHSPCTQTREIVRQHNL